LQERAPLKPGDPEYQRLAREEIEHYTDIFLGEAAAPSAQATLLQPVPPSWVEVELRAEAMVRQRTGFDLSGHVLSHLRQPDGVRMLSLGCGPGGIEVAFAREAPDAHIRCIDLNPELIRLGRERAEAEHLDMQFEVGDLNLIELPPAEYDMVFCHASLHQVLELERLVAQIRNTLRDEGNLIIVDVCTRNGYLMWPETKEIVQDLFTTLPPRFRINHTAYGKPRLDEQILETDTSSVSMECIRAQDIVPILSNTFQVLHFVPYFSLCRRLVDTMYGPNYDLTQSLDTALFNWIWELDKYYLSSNRLRPETFFGVYRK
jgi:ubiquinone/menaquinone biosynthesis C-methylase UbiE